MHHSNPLDDDTDNDDIGDWEEVRIYLTDPNKSDTDDGLNDGEEISLGANPLDLDTDNDLWNDSIDPMPTNFFVPNLAMIPTLLGIVAVIVFIRRRRRVIGEAPPPSEAPTHQS